MLVIVEGVDGSGKTTLCKQLIKLGGVKVNIKRGSKNQFDKYWSYMFKDCKFLICDRSFITDLVYRLQDDKPKDDLTLNQMCQILSAGSKIIHCETDTAYEDAMTRGEDNIIDKSQSDNIKKLYDVIITMFNKFLNVPVYKYNWKKQNIDDIMKFIKGGH